MFLRVTPQRIHTGLALFWHWYERHYRINVAIAAGLFLFQVVHLYWLATDVIAVRLTGVSVFPDIAWLRYLIIAVDYTEIPALLSVSLLYLSQLRRQFSWRAVLFLVLLNSQWLHLFWITDELVVNQFAIDLTEPGPDHGGADIDHTVLPVWVAWIAILIDYLEVPVMIDMVRTFWREVRRAGISGAVTQTFTRDTKDT